MAELARFLVGPDMPIQEVMAGIGDSYGIALVVDDCRRLLGTVTDGDIRRAILAGMDLERPVEVMLEQPRSSERTKPLTAPVGTSDSKLLQLMTDTGLRHIPLVNDGGDVVDVVVLDELVKVYELPLTAVVMAGGLGTRLRPLTDDLPKPMLAVGDRPLLEHIIDQLKTAGVRRVEISTHYKGHLIRDHFGDGSDYGLDIRYVDEEEPLGTAGSLSLVEPSDEPVLVINGDIVTKVNLRAMLDFHKEHGADMTVAVRHHELQVPFGVVELDEVDVTGITEKPTTQVMINAGIYLLAPEVCRLVPSGRRYDMTELINDLIEGGRRVIGFPVQEYWLDIGGIDDYTRADLDATGGSLGK